MNRRHAVCLIALLLFTLVTCQTTQASLVIDISGISGSRQTEWEFSGSSTAARSDWFGPSADFKFRGIGEFVVSLQRANFTATSTTASITTGSGTEVIDSVYVDNDFITRDDIGIGAANALPVSYGDEVSWTGSLIAPLDISELRVGSYGPANFLFTRGGLTDIQVNVEALPNPEPASVAIWGALIGCVVFWRRRRRA